MTIFMVTTLTSTAGNGSTGQGLLSFSGGSGQSDWQDSGNASIIAMSTDPSNNYQTFQNGNGLAYQGGALPSGSTNPFILQSTFDNINTVNSLALTGTDLNTVSGGTDRCANNFGSGIAYTAIGGRLNGGSPYPSNGSPSEFWTGNVGQILIYNWRSALRTPRPCRITSMSNGWAPLGPWLAAYPMPAP